MYKGIIVDGMVKILEPPTLNGREYFKLDDDRDLFEYKEGTVVSFVFAKMKSSGQKLATITGRWPEEEVIPDNVVKLHTSPLPRRILHFYVVFNPMFNTHDREEIEGPTQAHSFYNLLKKRITADPSSFLYWGKLRSTDSNGPLVLNHFTGAIQQNENQKHPTHLYISDFNSFWVARVESVTDKLSAEEVDNHTLNFYKNNLEKIELWFKVTDMTLICNSPKETNELIYHLHILPDNHLNSRQDPANALPVTPYLSGLRYPLIIEDIRKETYFAYDSNRKTILEPHVLLENGEDETARARSMILSYAIPENVFKMFSHQVQHEILGAEIMSLRGGGSSREDVYWKDYNVARKYLIALEKSLNDVLKASNPPSNSSFFEIDMNITLKQLYHDLLGNQHNYLILRNRELYNFFNGLKGTLCKWNEIRNLTVHLGDLLIDHESLLNVRRVLLGVGTQSVLVAMHQAAYPELRDLYNIEVPLPNKKTA